MIRRITLGAATLALGLSGLFSSPANAFVCDNLIHQDVAGLAYIEVRSNGDLWIYAENNGQSGLQRGGEGGITTLSAADCPESSNPDLIIF